jgi:molybdopterin-guanine dinucleotide biosynthesis protein A
VVNVGVEPPVTEGFAAIVLAGGRARRLGGADKPMVEVGGKALLHRVLTAVAAANPVIAVGPERGGFPGVMWTREDPPGGGPVAALAAGLALVPSGADVVLVLAGDLTGVTEETVRRLLAALGDRDGAVLVDQDGRRQWLLGVWRRDALRGALPANPAGAALRRTLGVLSIVDVSATAAGETADVDTHADLERARRAVNPDAGASSNGH